MTFDPLLLVLAILGLLGLAVLSVRLLRRGRSPSRTQEASDVDAVVAQASTKESLRHLAEDAGVKGEMTGSGWRPVRFTDAVTTRPAATAHEESVPEAASVDGSDMLLSKEWVRVGQVFSPAAPVARQDLFAGRHQQMEALIDVAFERGQHAVIYGERGVGKTSLATIMTAIFGLQATKLAVKINCDATDTYDSLWRKVFDEFDFVTKSSGISEADATRMRTILRDVPETPLEPNDVRKALRLLANIHEPILFLDEFERLQGRSVKAHFADTLKMLSDQQVPATIVIVGVADNIEELLTEHRSIERALVQVHMPRMAPVELEEIVRRGLEIVDMKVEDAALELITWFSQGLPHFTHLIAQASARAAIDEGGREIRVTHLNRAVISIHERAPESILNAYHRAVQSNRETLYPMVLLSAAMAATDEHGFFAAADLVVPLSFVSHRPYDIPAFSRHLHALSSPERGAVLLRRGASHRFRFRFSNALLQPYILMQGVSKGLIPLDSIPDELKARAS